MQYRTWVEVNTKALIHNVKIFKKLALKSELMAIVKSNAYGHGLVGTTKAFLKGGASFCGVDSLEEAIALRNAGIRKPIVVMGYVMLTDIPLLFKYQLRPVVYTLETLRKISEYSKRTKQKLFIHIKIETGTNRQGILLHQIQDFARILHVNELLILEGITTHFANIEDAHNQIFALTQLKKLEEAILLMKAHNLYPRIVHCAASSAILVFPKSHYNLIRPGIGLYGLWPSAKMSSLFKNTKIHLRPALSWKTHIAQIKNVSKGSPVGYGLTEKVKRNSRIAVLPVGYFDGYDRRLSSIGHVLILGKRAKVLGRVCMNMIMVDVTDIPQVSVEDIAILIGGDSRAYIGADELAEKTKTINYEIVSRINPLLPRMYI